MTHGERSRTQSTIATVHMQQAGVKRINAHNKRCSSSTTAAAAAAAGSSAEQAAVIECGVTDFTVTAQYTIQLAPQPHFSKVRGVVTAFL
jgi:predicted secreted protein